MHGLPLWQDHKGPLANTVKGKQQGARGNLPGECVFVDNMQSTQAGFNAQ